MKNTLIIGASENPERYSYRAANLLKKHGHNVFPFGNKVGKVADEPIVVTQDLPKDNIDTITMYIGPNHQPSWYNFILNVKPKRVIFNPGTENPELEEMLKKAAIPFEDACTLVLLNTGQY